MKCGDKVRIRKLKHNEDAESAPGDWDTYELGAYAPETGLPVDYWSEGTLKTDIKLGGRVHIKRTNRNGVEVPGEMRTSQIRRLSYNDEDGLKVETLNSVYHVEKL